VLILKVEVDAKKRLQKNVPAVTKHGLFSIVHSSARLAAVDTHQQHQRRSSNQQRLQKP
jgi:hypothetical protein